LQLKLFLIYRVNSVPSSSKTKHLGKTIKNKEKSNKKSTKTSKHLNKNKNINTNIINML